MRGGAEGKKKSGPCAQHREEGEREVEGGKLQLEREHPGPQSVKGRAATRASELESKLKHIGTNRMPNCAVINASRQQR